MFYISKGSRYQRGHLFWNRMKNRIIPSEEERANFGTEGKRHVLTISKTKGEPSTSTNLKEALCEKIPVYYDLLRKFRRNFGPAIISEITVDNLYDGLSDVKTIVRETSEIDPKHGIIYRGLTIPEVITLLPRQGNSPIAEAVFWLLLTGDIPTQQQTAALIADWTSRRQKCIEWWSGPRGETIISILRSMPETITPLHRLSMALAIFDISKQAREAKRSGVLPYTYWEYTYEDGMEFLANLPAIVGLVAKGEMLSNVDINGDWIQFLSNCLINANKSLDSQKLPIADFLRLYVTLNADDDGGAPTAHITQILGSTDLNINEILASSVLAYANEPRNGTMLQWQELQTKIRSMLGCTWTEHTLKACVTNLWSRNKLIGHKEADICDPRYTVLLNYAKQYLSNNSELKLSQDITRILKLTMKIPKEKDIQPEQNAIAGTIFQCYGLKDMRFNQTIFFMARALGAIASIIWATIINAPVEYPISKCTYSYIESIGKNKKNIK